MEKLRKYIRALGLLFLPSWLISLIYGKKIRIGFSLIFVEKFNPLGGGKIGHLNICACRELILKEDALIGNFNIIKGHFRCVIGKGAEVKLGNKISGPLGGIYGTFEIGDNSSIQTKHIIDMTSNVLIGNNVLLAGVGTQIWTHHFQKGNDIWQRNEVVGDVVIKDNVIINSRCTICDHVSIGSNIVLGANTCVYKNLEEPGLYVNSPILRKEYIPEKAFEQLTLLKDFECRGNKLRLFRYA